MSIKVLKEFSEKSKSDDELKDKLKACLKVKELLALCKDYGCEIEEDTLYPPNEPQFTADQLSERMAKALLRA